ncbi:hypothetical protein [Tenacibaculum piscium]|uniref:hypothetical protein n=1 Tax=Tenacibaculum piscium TaxID=1458515 RepID=UPI001F1604D7|nr:hypothetical protein [Tenacibaculum piscium]
MLAIADNSIFFLQKKVSRTYLIVIKSIKIHQDKIIQIIDTILIPSRHPSRH